ncbi:MAG: transcription antitermination factor NusB [Anaerovoracaceae bacterium]
MKKSEIIEKKVAEREHMMQMLYQMNMLNDFSQEAFDSFLQMQMTEAGVTGYSRQLYEAFALHREEIDAEIEKNSIKWKIQRMPAVDLSILRLALTEIRYIDTIPVSVSINEAVNLAKKFSTDKSSSFINGVLGNAVKEA